MLAKHLKRSLHTLLQSVIHHVRCFCLFNPSHFEAFLNEHVGIATVADLREPRVCIVTLHIVTPNIDNNS